MSSFFRKETKNRILIGLTASAVLASSLIGMTTKAFAEDTAPAMTVTVASAPANPATTEKWDYVFDTNGGSFADGSTTKTVTLDSYSASVNAPATPSKPGMTFVGWADIPNSDARGTKGVYTVDASNAYETGNTDENGNVTHTRTLYAVYKLNIDITGTTEAPVYRFDANGGHTADGTDTVVEVPATSGMTDDNVPAPTVVRDGYTFVGWGRRPDSNGMSNLGTTNVNFLPAISDEIPMTNDTGRVYHTVYAIWKQNVTTTDAYNYVFDGNGGYYDANQGTTTATVSKETDVDVAGISTNSMPHRYGYTFVGWGTTATATEAQSVGVNAANFSSITPTDSTAGTVNTHTRTVYAIWKANQTIVPVGRTNTYIFDANGGTIEGTTYQASSIDGQDPAGATSVAAPKAVKPGYEFVGWAKDRSASASFVLGTDHVDFSSVDYQSVPDEMGNVTDMYHVYAIYKVSATPYIPGTGEHVPTDGVPPILEPVSGKNTIMFYSGKLNKGDTEITNTGDHTNVVSPKYEYSLTDGTMVKRWISTDGATILTPGGTYDSDTIANKVFVADYVTPAPQDYDPTQNYPQNVSHIQLAFHANGGADAHGSNVYVITGNINATDLPIRPTYTREGYTFKGWARNAADTESNVTVSNNMIDLKSIGQRSEITDTKDPSKVIVFYHVYAVWQKNEVTPDTPGGHNGTITPQSSGWRQENGQFRYYKEDGTLVTSQWIKDDSGWHYVDASGNAASGWFTTPNGKTWYFDPTTSHNAASIGETQIGDKSYFFDEGYGLSRNSWISHSDGSWSYAESDGSFHSGWKHMPNGKWFYFDTEDASHRMKVGTFQTQSGTYYIDVNNGMTANGWVQLSNGGWAWAQSSGAFASGWFNTPNGKTWYFDPSDSQHALLVGDAVINGKSYYFDSGYGLTRNGWIHRADGSWSYANSDGSLCSGWKHMSNGKWFYFDTNDSQHRMLTGVIKLPSGSYYIDESAGMAANGWVKLPNGGWAWAGPDGALTEY